MRNLRSNSKSARPEFEVSLPSISESVSVPTAIMVRVMVTVYIIPANIVAQQVPQTEAQDRPCEQCVRVRVWNEKRLR